MSAAAVFLVFVVGVVGISLFLLLKPNPHDDPSYRLGHDKFGPGNGWSGHSAGMDDRVACQLAINGQEFDNSMTKHPKNFDHDKALQGCLDYLDEHE